MPTEDAGGSPGIGETSRRLADLVRDFRAVVTKLDESYVTKEYFGLAQNALSDRLKSIEDAAEAQERLYEEKVKNLTLQVDQERTSRQWAVRMAATAFVAAGVDLVLRAKGVR